MTASSSLLENILQLSLYSAIIFAGSVALHGGDFSMPSLQPHVNSPLDDLLA